MLKIRKSFPSRKLYMYGAATSVVCVAGVTGIVVQSHSLHERLMAATSVKSDQKTNDNREQSPESTESPIASGNANAMQKNTSQTSSAAPSASSAPSASPDPSPSSTPTPTPSETPTLEPEPTPETPVDPSQEPTVE